MSKRPADEDFMSRIGDNLFQKERGVKDGIFTVMKPPGMLQKVVDEYRSNPEAALKNEQYMELVKDFSAEHRLEKFPDKGNKITRGINRLKRWKSEKSDSENPKRAMDRVDYYAQREVNNGNWEPEQYEFVAEVGPKGMDFLTVP